MWNGIAIVPKQFWRAFILTVLAGFLLGTSCQERGFITPPTQIAGLPFNALNTNTAEQSPSFDYSGRYLAFASDRGPARGIFVYDIQQRRLLPLPELNQAGSFQDEPAISADGRYIVYISERSGKADVWLYDRVSSRSENLTQNRLGQVRHPTISGNGRFVAYEANRSGQWDLEIYDRGPGIDLSLPSNTPSSQSPPEPSPTN